MQHSTFVFAYSCLTSNDLSDEDEVDFSIYRRSSSRASNSSGCLSVPASEPIDISDNGESEHEDDDPVLQASLSGLQVAHKRAPPVSSPPVNPSSKNSTARYSTPADKHQRKTRQIKQDYPMLDLSEVPPAPRSQSRSSTRTNKRNAIEVPSGNDARGSLVSRATSVHPLVKKEARVVVLPLDDDSDNIQIRWSAGGAINLKEQHPDVQKVLRLVIDYYMGNHMMDNFYPDVHVRANFILESLVCAAEDLHLPNIASAVVVEVNGGRALSKYGEALAVVPQGRISSFRGIAKSTAKAGLYGNYKVQNDCVARVEHLMKGQAFIYKQKPDIIVFGRPDTDTPYLHDAIADGVGGFLKTKTAECCADMFPRNDKGNIEATIPVVALTCAGIYSTLDDWTTGEYKATDFEGKRVQEVYDIHFGLLQRMKGTKPEQYHATMEAVFAKAASGTSRSEDWAI
ncbi:hypothetical protein B0H14DRAFT_3787630 [Mycena olivaceomarginata]|nr:hypothetical protein B0H14DRAFT_3787630 [Mycena olivaceomarginata]